MPDQQSPGASADLLWRLRWWTFASGVVCLAALVLVKLELSLGWSWSLFVWGLAAGLVGAAGINGLLLAASRVADPDPAALQKLQRRRLIYTWMWLFVGLEGGILAAMLDIAWIDIAIAAYVALVIGFGALVLLIAKRRRPGVAPADSEPARQP